ncbi:MAG: hypothetical protein KAT86_00685 [Candidatus Latescibacteria bacterium]|nr:hypothetical protein [Candidatus Latescibacterota bacterium]
MSRGLVKKAVEFDSPERVPFIYWIDSRTFQKYGEALTDFLRDFPEDMCQLNITVPKGWQPQQDGGNEWGCKRSAVGSGASSLFEKQPLQDWDAFQDYSFPDPYAPGRFEQAKKRKQVFPDSYLLGTVGNTIFERMQFLHGVANTLEDFYLHPDMIEELADRIVEFDIGLIEQWAELGVDGIFFMDDYGFQDQLAMSPEHFRQIFKPRYQQMIQLSHELGLHTFLHTCGNVHEIIPDLIEIGLDVLQGLQPHAVDIGQVGRRFRGQICFMGGLDAQRTLPFGTSEEVRQMVKRCIQHLGTSKGGFIGSPSTEILPDTPLENIKAVFCSWREFGYPEQ